MPVSWAAAATAKSRSLPGLVVATYRVRAISGEGPGGSLDSGVAGRNDACPRRRPARETRSREASGIPPGRGRKRHPPTAALQHISVFGERARDGRRCGADTHPPLERDGAARRAEWHRRFPLLRRAASVVGGGLRWLLARRDGPRRSRAPDRERRQRP